MVINISLLKEKILWVFLIFLPLFLGMIPSYDMYINYPNRSLSSSLAVLGLFIILILTGLTSIIVFKGGKRIWNYIFSIIGIIYILLTLYNGKLFSTEKYSLLDGIFILINVYGLYVVFFGVIRFKNYIKSLFRTWLRKKNIHIISTQSEKNIKEKYPDLDFSNPIDFENRFSKFNSSILEINKLLSEYSTNMIAELKLFEHDALSIKKKLAEESTNLLRAKEELEKINKIKNISEEQIDALLEKQNKDQANSVIIGFVLGIIGSLIASFVYDNLIQ